MADQRKRRRKRKREETKSSMPPASLPVDIILEILLISPAKAVGRFRCLSKSFYTFLTDPQLIHRHTLQANEKAEDHRLVSTFTHLYTINLETAGLVPRQSILAKKVGQPFQPFSDYRFLGSCNGLLCHYRYPDKFLVSNPLTREYRQVWVHGFGFGKNPSMFLGFGFDHSSKDYKILRGWLSGRGWETQVFSVKNDCWKSLGAQESSALPKTTTMINLPVVSLQGAIHWDANKESNFKSIASFDLVKEELRDIMLPPSDQDQEMVVPCCISALRGRLCMSRQCLQTNGRTDVWTMKEYGVPESWTKQLSIELCWNVKDYWVPICHSKNDRIIFQNQKKRGLIVYNPKDKEFIKRQSPKGLPHNFPHFWMATYVETLVSINN